MAIVTLTQNETGADSLIDINANFVDLDTTKADLASPTFTGTPNLPTGTVAVTQSASDNSTKVATTAYVDTSIAASGNVSLSTATVFSTANAPTSWTDLDLSATIGTATRIVMLRVNNENSGTNITYAFRPNGDTRDYYYATGAAASLLTLNTDDTGIAIVKTDSAGVIEWQASGAQSTSINLMAYW